jgi:hypothetical protein
MPDIQIKRGLSAALSATNPVVASGEPIFETDTLKLKIGDGVTAYNSLGVVGTGSFLLLSGGTLTGSISSPSGNFTESLQVNGTGVSLSGHTHIASNITDFNSSVSGLLPVKNIVAGSNTTIVSSGGIYTINASSGGTNISSTRGVINATGTLSSFNISGGYSVGFLDVFQNGVKLISGSDFTASNGTSVSLSISVASGTVLEYVGYGTTAASSLSGVSPGSVSAPTLSSYNDISTGFYFPSSGTFAIASSGYDRFKIDNKGDIFVGGENISGLRYLDINNINNSSSAGSILRLITTNVSGTGNTSADLVKYKNGQFTINNADTSPDTFTTFNVGNLERLRITSSGNIGIGTTSPTSKLHVVGNSNLAGTLTFNDFTESVVVIGNSSTSKTIALTNGTVQTCTLTGNCTFTMPTATAGKSFTLFLSSGSGSFTATFTGVKWSGGTAPVITTTASKVDILSFISDGTSWYGAFSQNY